MRLFSRRNTFVVVVLMAMVVVYWAIYYLTPSQVDDLLFVNNYKSLNSGSADFSFSSFAKYFMYMRENENGRLPNVICPFWVLYFPRFIGTFLLAIMTSLMIYFMSVASHGVSFRFVPTPLRLIVTWLIVVVFLPWRGGMFVTDLTLNYIPVLLFNILFYMLFLREQSDEKAWVIVAVSLFSLFCGWQHEGMSVLMIGALGIYIFIRKFKLSLAQWLMFGAYALGCMMVISAPGILARLTASDEIAGVEVTVFIVLRTIPMAILLFGASGLLLLSRFSHRFIKVACKPDFYIPAAIVILGCMLCARTSFQFGRSAWFGEAFAIIAFVNLLGIFFQSDLKKIVRKSLYAIFALILLFFMGVIYWQWHYYKEHRRISALLDKSESGTVYYDLSVSAPLYTLKYPVDNTWINPVQLVILNTIYPGRTIAIVPECLENIEKDKIRAICGSADMFRYKDVFLQNNRNVSFLDNAGNVIPNVDVGVEYYDFYNAQGEAFYAVPSLCQKFVAEDGETWVYVHPLDKNLHGNIIKVNLSTN